MLSFSEASKLIRAKRAAMQFKSQFLSVMQALRFELEWKAAREGK